MNVQLGQLAIIIRSSAGNQGKIGKVVAGLGNAPVYYEDWTWFKRHDGFAWLLEFPNPIPDNQGDTSSICPCLDAWLRPVSGLPLEEITEEIEPCFIA